MGRALLDEQLDDRILGGLAAGIRGALGESPVLARRAGLLPDEAEGSCGLAEGLLQLSREASAPLIGAAALALDGDDAQDVAQEPPSG